MGFWSDLKKANPFESMKRGDELGTRNIVDIIPIYDPNNCGGEIKNGYLVCDVCRVEIGNVSKAQPFAVTVDKTNQLTFSNKNKLTVCSECLKVFNIR